ncbi:Hsp70 family protein, partial [Klebsiella pneumoniae]
EIARMLEDSFRKADEDRDARALREQLVDAQRLLEAVEAALAVDGERLLSADERVAIDSQVAELRGLLDSQDVLAIERQTKRLSQITDAFAARRL